MGADERLAITGANGWLGRSLVRAALAAGLPLRGLVRSEGGAGVVVAAGGEVRMVGDLESERLAEALEGCRAVIHLAGVSAERGGATYEAVNVGGARRLVEAARCAGVRRIVFLSGLGVARYGQARRVTNGYFLAKLAVEVELFRSELEILVFRPSYVVGADDELIPALLSELAEGEMEIVGDGGYRLQPVALDDVCHAVLRACTCVLQRHTVVDLVGPETVRYRDFVERVAQIAHTSSGRVAAPWRVRSIAVEEADRRAAAGGYRGLLPDELDVLLCDEVADSAPLVTLVGAPLTALDETIRRAVAGSSPRPHASFRR